VNKCRGWTCPTLFFYARIIAEQEYGVLELGVGIGIGVEMACLLVKKEAEVE